MELTMITIKNFTTASIELYRSSIDSQIILAGQELKLPTLDKDCIHGHSSTGSLIIFRDNAPFVYKSFGKITVIYRHYGKDIVFEIVEKH